MRVRVLCCVLALGLTGCSLGEVASPPPVPEALPVSEPAYRKLVAGGITTILGDPSRAAPMQISGLRRVDTVKGPSWLTCVQANANTQPRSYAVFIQGERIVESRMAVMIDRCEEQVYQPFGMFAESSSAIR
jgi:hypothetical protein